MPNLIAPNILMYLMSIIQPLVLAGIIIVIGLGVLLYLNERNNKKW